MYHPQSLYSGLVEYWPLHEASGDAFGLCAGMTLTDNGGVTQNPGIVTTARQFAKASSQRLSKVTEANVEFADSDFSIACWVYLTTKTTTMGIVTKDDTSAQRDYSLRYFVTSDQFNFIVFKAGDTAVNVFAATLGSPATATWYFIVCTHDATNDLMTIEVNMGGEDSQATGGALQAAQTANFRVGDNAGATNFLDGRVCELGLWKRLLTKREKYWLYNGGRGRTFPFFDGQPSSIDPFNRIPGILVG